MYRDSGFVCFAKGDEEKVGIMAPGEKAMRFFNPELYDDDYEEDEEEDDEDEENDITDY